MTDEQPTSAQTETDGTGDTAAIDPGAIDPASVDPAEFAKSLSSVSDEQLAEAMSSEMRPVILGEIFKRMEEHFRADQAANTEAVIHWRITRDGSDHDHYEVVIGEGNCTVNEEPEHEPRVSFKTDGVTFLRLVTGNASGPMLFMTGKLKIEGDMMFAPQVQSLFRIPS